MKLRGWVMPAVVLMVGVGSTMWLMQGPVRTTQDIQRALTESNTVALTQHIDFPQLRVRVKDRLVRTAVAHTPARGTPLETIAILGGPALIAPVVDATLTPEALVGGAQAGKQWSSGMRKALSQTPDVTFERHDRARVLLKHPEVEMVLFMERDGLRWRVVDATVSGITWNETPS